MDAAHRRGACPALQSADLHVGRRTVERSSVRSAAWLRQLRAPDRSRARTGSRSVGLRLRRLVRRPHRPALCGAPTGRACAGLALASALAPGFEPDARAQVLHACAAAADAAVLRQRDVNAQERKCARRFPTWRERLRFSVRQGWNVATAPPAPRLMRDRLRLLDGRRLRVLGGDASRRPRCSSPAMPSSTAWSRSRTRVATSDCSGPSSACNCEGTGHHGTRHAAR